MSKIAPGLNIQLTLHVYLDVQKAAETGNVPNFHAQRLFHQAYWFPSVLSLNERHQHPPGFPSHLCHLPVIYYKTTFFSSLTAFSPSALSKAPGLLDFSFLHWVIACHASSDQTAPPSLISHQDSGHFLKAAGSAGVQHIMEIAPSFWKSMIRGTSQWQPWGKPLVSAEIQNHGLIKPKICGAYVCRVASLSFSKLTRYTSPWRCLLREVSHTHTHKGGERLRFVEILDSWCARCRIVSILLPGQLWGSPSIGGSPLLCFWNVPDAARPPTWQGALKSRSASGLFYWTTYNVVLLSWWIK